MSRTLVRLLSGYVQWDSNNLTATETGNGFGNRFLWVSAKRSTYLPDGGNPDAGALAVLSNDFRLVIDRARQRGELRRVSAASARWRAVHQDLSEGRPGLLGRMTGEPRPGDAPRVPLVTPVIGLQRIRRAAVNNP